MSSSGRAGAVSRVAPSAFWGGYGRRYQRCSAPRRPQQGCKTAWRGSCGPKGFYWSVSTDPRTVHDVFRDITRDFQRPGKYDTTNYGDSCAKSFPIDILEDDTMYEIQANLPGLKRDDLKVQLGKDGTLTIRGEAQTKADRADRASGVEQPDSVDANPENKRRRRRMTERPTGPFLRKLKLPSDAVTDSLSAKLQDGVLTIKLWKKEADVVTASIE